MKDLWIDMTLKVDELDVRLMDGNTVVSKSHVTVYELGKELSKLNNIIKEENDKIESVAIIKNNHFDYREDTMDSYVQALFNWDGRLSRLQYFGYSVLNTVSALIVGLILFGLLTLNNAAISLIAVIGLFLVVGAYAYSNMAVTAKRLHDLGYGAINLLWIWLVGMAGSATEQGSPALSTVLSIVSIGIGLYLLFAPGNTGSNQYGDSPVPPGPPATGNPA